MRGARFFVLGAFAAAYALFPIAVMAVTPSPSEHSAIVASPASLTFADGASQTRGADSQTITVTNLGNATAMLTSATLANGFVWGYPAPTPCAAWSTTPTMIPVSLVPNGSCKVTIVVMDAGPLQGSLTIHDNSPHATPADLVIPLIALGPPPPTPTPTPTPIPTPQGSIFLNPGSAPAASRVTFSANGLDPNQNLAVLFDGSPLVSIDTDGSGNATIQLAVPDSAPVGNHQVCVRESNGNVCSGFIVEAAAPAPTSSASPSPSPSPSSTASALAAAPTPVGGSSPLALLIKSPFVFLPIIAVIGLLAFLALYRWRARPAPPIGEVTILHRAPPPRVYEPQPDAPPAAPTAPSPPPVTYESPAGPTPAPPAAKPPAPSSGADVPPDLPEASD